MSTEKEEITALMSDFLEYAKVYWDLVPDLSSDEEEYWIIGSNGEYRQGGDWSDVFEVCASKDPNRYWRLLRACKAGRWGNHSAQDFILSFVSDATLHSDYRSFKRKADRSFKRQASRTRRSIITEGRAAGGKK